MWLKNSKPFTPSPVGRPKSLFCKRLPFKNEVSEAYMPLCGTLETLILDTTIFFGDFKFGIDAKMVIECI